jgi:hypothetical protein
VFVEGISVFLLRRANGAVDMGPDLRSQWAVYWLRRDGEMVLCFAQWEALCATKRWKADVYFHSPVAGFSLLVFRGFLITHNDAAQSVGLLWTSDQSLEPLLQPVNNGRLKPSTCQGI